jgi:arsenite oxidase small subunit
MPRRTCRSSQLRVDDKGDIYAEGADELIYGRLSNVLQG